MNHPENVKVCLESEKKMKQIQMVNKNKKGFDDRSWYPLQNKTYRRL